MSINIFKTLAVLITFCFLFLSTGDLYCAKMNKNDITDNKIKAAVEADLLLDSMVSSHLLDVKVNDGIVTVSGDVGNILAADRAIKLAQSIKGVRSVIDKVEVFPVTRNDSEIRKDVIRALLKDPATDSYEINVQVDKGKVKLKGKVDSWTEKNLVEKAVKGVIGVRGISNDITVKLGKTRPDNEIKSEIEKSMEYDPFLTEETVHVEVNNGNVILTGTVGSANVKSMMTTKAYIAGVKSVDNDLDIEWWAKDRLKRKEKSVAVIKSDKKLENAIKDSLIYDPRVNKFKIDVGVHHGVATLTGKVDNLMAKRSAYKDASNTIGIWRVKNQIKVRPEKEISDTILVKDVRESLLWDPILNDENISIAAMNRKLYLYGTVDSVYKKQRAAEIASQTTGVVDIKNNLKLAYKWVWKSDRAIAEDIRDQLFWSFMVDSDDISVKVKNGTATLTGQVNDILEHRAAVRNAFEAGARKVHDKLKVKYVKCYPEDNFYEYYPPGIYFNTI